MRIILLHGEDYQKSYDRLFRFIDAAKKREWKIERIDVNENIPDRLVAQSLFNDKKLFIIEDVEKLSKEKISWLRENLNEIEGTMVLFSKKSLSKTIIKSLPKLYKEEVFEVPKIIWSFLDSLYPGNSTNSLRLFHKLIKNAAPEFIFSLCAKQVRDMYFLKVNPKSIDYPSWRKNKLMNQMRKYSDGKLESLILKLSEADLKTKRSHANITDLLDFIIISELE